MAFPIDGISGVPGDPRPLRGDSTRRTDAPKKRADQGGVTFRSGRVLQAIERAKEGLARTTASRLEQVEAAREDLLSGRLINPSAIERAAASLLAGERSIPAIDDL